MLNDNRYTIIMELTMTKIQAACLRLAVIAETKGEWKWAVRWMKCLTCRGAAKYALKP